MKILRTLSGFALVLGLAATAGEREARAAGAALDASDLPPKLRTELRAEIDKARAQTPDLFRQAQQIAVNARELDATSQKHGVPFTRHFKTLGPRAFYPLIELLAFDSHAEAGLPETAKAALREGLIEAIGAIRDPRATPVMALMLERAHDDGTVRASAEALARIGTDEAVSSLTSAAQKVHVPGRSSPREQAILRGMHDCRRQPAARLLADRLDAKPDEDTAKVLAKSLGGVGNAWAWKTISIKTEESTVRATAAQALVRAYVSYRGDVRDAAKKALLVVDDPSTPALVATARRGADRELAAALDDLDKAVAENPTR